MATTTQSENPTAINFGSIPGSPNVQNTVPTANPNFKLTPSNMSILGVGLPSSNSVSGSAPIVTPSVNHGLPNPAGGYFPSTTPTQLGGAPVIPTTNLFNNPQVSGGNGNSGGVSPQTTNGTNQPVVSPPVTPPAGYMWNAQGTGFQPISAAPNPDVTGDTSTEGNVSDLGQGSSQNDVQNAILQNLENYQSNSGASAAEQQAEQTYLQALSAYQQRQTAVTAGEMDQYNGGGPVSLASGAAQTIGMENQFGLQTLQNQENVAQANLGYQQTQQQLGIQSGQNVLQDLLSVGSQGLSQQQINLSALSYSKMTADQQAQFDVSYFQTFGTMPPASITGEDAGGSETGNSNGQSGATATPTFNQDSSTQNMTSSDFMGYDISSYATDPNYSSKLTPLYQAAQQGISSISPSAIQNYINQVAPGSPVTGQMIYNASSTGGGTGAPVDPYLLVAQEQLESNFGTEGQATSTMNPANVGNTGSSTQTMPNWQAGVNAQAAWLANHPAQQSNSSTGSDAFTSAVLTQAQSYFPSTVSQAVQVMSNGIPYLNIDNVPSNLQTMASNIAGENGIKVFHADAVSGLEALSNISDALNKMTTLSVQDLRPANGGVGTLENMVGNWFGSLTGTNPSLADFGVFKDSAVKSVTALAGGAGSGLKLNTGTIEAAVNNLPTQNDSQEVAIEKIDETRDLLNIQMASVFGNPSLAQGVLTMNGHTYMPGDVVTNGQGGLGTVNADGSVTPIQ